MLRILASGNRVADDAKLGRTLPYAALQYRYGVNRVFVVQGDRLAVRELQVGERLGDRIEVTSGVKAGEQVAITDVESLVDGALVSVTAK